MIGIKIEMLTERRILLVQSGPLVGLPDRVEVDVCVKCGAVVLDPAQHDRWHRADEPETKGEKR